MFEGVSNSIKQKPPGRRSRVSRSARVVSVTTLLGAIVAALLAGAAMASTAKPSSVKACGYYMDTSGGAGLENIRVMDRAAAGSTGTLVFKARGVSETKSLKLGTSGVALVSFPVISAGTETIAVHLRTAPPTSGMFHFRLAPLATDVAAPDGCTPR